RGGPGRDRYLFLRGGGDADIEENGLGGEVDSRRCAGAITPAEGSVGREGAGLEPALPGADGRSRMREWFGAEAMRVERLGYRDGTTWGVATMASRAGQPAPGTPPAATEEPAPGPDSTDGSPIEPPVTGEPPAVPPYDEGNLPGGSPGEPA